MIHSFLKNKGFELYLINSENWIRNNNYINSSKRVYLRSDIIKNKLNSMNQLSLNQAEQNFKNMN